MSNKVRFYHVWDWKQILNTFGFLFVLTGLFYLIVYSGEIVTNYRLSQYDKITSGKLINIEEKTALFQNKFGSHEVVITYNVSYSYSIDDQTFTNVDHIPGSILNGQRLKKLTNRVRPLKVKYNSNKPNLSAIDVLEH
ncbi:MAG: hypothetical protein AAFX87_09900 [Bacteroidota bacterium]